MLAEGSLAAGGHRLGWDGVDADGRRVANGLYFAKLVLDGTAFTHKLVWVR